MSVVIETTLGDITVDLFLDQRPITCLNFLKLCKMKYYNFNLFHSIRSGFIAQTGDPSGEGSGGESIWGLLDGPDKRFFSGEKMPKIRHTDAGLLSMVCTGEMMVGSQFFFTLGPDLDSLDGVHCVIGEVAEGQEVLRKLNDVICDETHRPYQDVRITHTVVLEDPFSDPPGLRAPSRSPSPSAERLKGGRIAPDEELDETQGKTAAEIQEIIEEKEAKARATILEIVGDLPDADIAPPENVLFVCKLNPVTTDEDLEIIFSRFGKIVSCEVIRDKKSGDSLQYAFIEFADKKSCEDAYFKMDNVLIDDRRIHVDFSQSVSKMRWLGKGRGVQHFNNEGEKDAQIRRERSKRSRSNDRQIHRRPASQEKHSESKRYDDKHRNKQSNSDKQHQRDHHVTKNKSHRERSRSKSKSRNDNKNDRNRHSYNEDKSKDRHNHQRSDDNIKDDSYKTKSSNHKTERSNKMQEDKSRSRYEEKSRNRNDDRSKGTHEDEPKHSNRAYPEKRDNKLKSRLAVAEDVREEFRQRNKNDIKDTRKDKQQRGRYDEIHNSDDDEKYTDKNQHKSSVRMKNKQDTSEYSERKKRKRSKSIEHPSRNESNTNEGQSDTEDENLKSSKHRYGKEYKNSKQDFEKKHRDKRNVNEKDDKYEENTKNAKRHKQDGVENKQDRNDKRNSNRTMEVHRYEERHNSSIEENVTHITEYELEKIRHQNKKTSNFQDEHDRIYQDSKDSKSRHEKNRDYRTRDKELKSQTRQERKDDDLHSDKDKDQKNHKTKSNQSKNSKVQKSDLDISTPTRREKKHKREELKKKNSSKDKKSLSKKKHVKRKRKSSTSDTSDSDSSDSSNTSSSSDSSSSSSDMDGKKKLKRKRKRSASSSSSDSSSSSSSDSSSSETSSSSSDSDKEKKKKKKKVPKQTQAKSKKK